MIRTKNYIERQTANRMKSEISRILRVHGVSQNALSRKMKVTGPTVSLFLSERNQCVNISTMARYLNGVEAVTR